MIYKIILFFRTFAFCMDKMEPIAIIRTGFPSKFGIPRQSGLVSSLKGTIVFQPQFRNADALRGLEGFSHIWLIWKFSETVREQWSPTVRPPRLGGNTRLGVFATRSPFRPNPIGLSCVKLDSIQLSSPDGPLLHVSGIDLMDGTPIYDIKPYIPYTDCHADATSGFTSTTVFNRLDVVIPASLSAKTNPQTLDALRGILSEDPRPHYQDDPDREYGFDYDGYSIRFKVEGSTLYVTDIVRIRKQGLL